MAPDGVALDRAGIPVRLHRGYASWNTRVRTPCRFRSASGCSRSLTLSVTTRAYRLTEDCGSTQRPGGRSRRVAVFREEAVETRPYSGDGIKAVLPSPQMCGLIATPLINTAASARVASSSGQNLLDEHPPTTLKSVSHAIAGA